MIFSINDSAMSHFEAHLILLDKDTEFPVNEQVFKEDQIYSQQSCLYATSLQSLSSD